MTPPDRLYGIPGAEVLHRDAADAIEAELDAGPAPGGRPFTIEEWSVLDPTANLPAVASVLEWISENLEEATEDFAEEVADAVLDDDVKAAAGELLNKIAAHVQYLMAGQLLRTLTVTFAPNGEPLLDGEPLYARLHTGSL